MIKRNVITATGIVLSFIIAIGGWLLTNQLIDLESDRLLAGTMSFVVDIPTRATPLQADDNHDYHVPLSLTNQEIVSILENWESSDSRRPHEPAAGQIDMEQAITVGREGLLFLNYHNILPTELMTFTGTGASLNQNTAHGEPFLPLEYSYWSVSFENEHIEVNMTINAATGQVWKIDVSLKHRAFIEHEMQRRLFLMLNVDDAINVLDAFVDSILDLEVYHDNRPWYEVLFTTDDHGVIFDARRSYIHPPPPTLYPLRPIPSILALRRFTDGNATAVISTPEATAVLADGVIYLHSLTVQLTTVVR